MNRDKEGTTSVKIIIMGQGYVGLPLAMAAVKAGHDVVGYEPDQRRCTLLQEGASYVEDVTDNTLLWALNRGYKPTTDDEDLKDFDVAVITVPTPLKKGIPDLSYVEAATTTLSLYLKPGATVILESTTFPGTTRRVVAPILETASDLKAGEDFHVGFSPERIDPGNKTWTFENTPKITSGLTPRCRNVVATFYSLITENVVVAETLEEAELAKVFENTYRQVNIALVTELGRHAHTLGVDVHNVLDLCATKPFGFTKFTPGPGVGGHCIPCDPVYLSHHLQTEYGQRFRIVELAQEINDSQPGYVVRRLQDALNHLGVPLNGAEILALGQAYKPGTADMRESPAVEVVNLLRETGARVTTVDPYFPEDDIDQLREIPTGPDRAVEDYDAVVLLTPHAEFDLQHIAIHASYVLDTRGVMPDSPNIERL
jgi:UDP-N-acetyl-D-glucosamine dehydrogenase